MVRRFFAISAIASLALLTTAVAPMAVHSELAEKESSKTEGTKESAEAERSPIQETLGVAFKSPEGFSEIRGLDRRTTGIVFPEGNAQRPLMTVRFAEMESRPDGWVKFNPSEQMMYAKYLFLGNNSPSGEYSQRTFFGKSLVGEAQTIRTRDGYRYIELFIVPLEKTQREIAIAFESDTRLPLATVENAIDTVTESMQELDESSKKKKKRKKRNR